MAENGADGRRPRVLIVEDSPTQAGKLRSFMKVEGLDVTLASSAETGLEQLDTDGADLILLDFHLPGMDGDAFCRKVRMNVNTRAIPILMLTAQGDDAAQLRSLDSGADDYLPKTVDPDVLRVRVRALLRKAAQPGPVIDVETRFKRARVLAIDDSPSYLYVLRRELQSEHYIVETAEGPQKGLELFRSAPFDCVLVDYEMPGLNGAEVCKEIRTARSSSEEELVLIMLSSHEEKERLTEGFEAGADDYISKSADFGITKARIRALLRRKFLVEENRNIMNELKEKELEKIRAEAAKDAAQVRATMADELERANRELALANQKLDRVNQDLEEFAHSAAHDLQEPLRMVSVYSQLLRRDFGASLPKAGSEYVTNCIEGAARMSGLIRSLLLYANASKAEEQSAGMVDLNAVLDNALGNLKTSIEESGAEISREPLPAYHADEIRIQQVFQNLIGNGIKYRRPGVPLRIHIGVEEQERDWLFTVEDNGSGIDSQYLTSIFDPFKRLDSKTSGSGLGLAICQRIIQRYGGRLWAESELGEWTRLRFTLPK